MIVIHDKHLNDQTTSQTVSNRPVLIIKAKGGLGNRMLSAVTGLITADLMGRDPIIDWRDGVYAPAGQNAYPKLFQSPIALNIEQFDNCEEATPDIWSGQIDQHPTDMITAHDPNRHSDPFIYRKYCIDLNRLKSNKDVAIFWSYLPKHKRLRRHLSKDPRFSGRRYEDIITEYLDRYFRPNPRVEDRLNDFFGGLSNPILGVHIRYTDRKVPLEPIFNAIGSYRKTHPGSAIFLATDNRQIQSQFHANYDNVHSIEKRMPKNGRQLHEVFSREEMLVEAENAMVDMWGLARSDFLIHSRNSTFSISSALIGQLSTAQQIDIESRSPKIVLKRWFQEYA